MTPARLKAANIDEYIAAASARARPHLRAMRACIRKAAPAATEGMKWSMPAFSQGRILVTFAAHTEHVGLYPTPAAIVAFAPSLTKYQFSKGGIQFPLDKPLPLPLIRRIVAFRVKECEEKDSKWRS